MIIMLLTGIQVSTPSGEHTAHAILLKCSADLPARSSITNMKNFNGLYGCLYCTNPGTTDPSAPLHRFWPRQLSTLRTKQNFIGDGKTALSSGESVTLLSYGFVENYCILLCCFFYFYFFLGKRNQRTNSSQYPPTI